MDGMTLSRVKSAPVDLVQCPKDRVKLSAKRPLVAIVWPTLGDADQPDNDFINVACYIATPC